MKIALTVARAAREGNRLNRGDDQLAALAARWMLRQAEINKLMVSQCKFRPSLGKS